MKDRLYPARLIVVTACLVTLCGAVAAGQETPGPVTPPGEPTLETPTTTSLGAWWIVEGGQACRVEMAYRKAAEGKQAAEADWRKSMPMFKVRPGDTCQKTHRAELNPPDTAQLFAGSIVGLAPGTEYELKLTLVKPDGTTVEKLLKSRTWTEPVEPAGMRVYHVVPGKGGGDGSEKDPFRGLAYAQTEAEPGTLFLVHKGTYDAPFYVVRSGTPDKPVIWRGAGDGDAVIDGGGAARQLVEMHAVHDVWIERLSMRGAYMAVLITGAERLVIRRCHLFDVKCGIYGDPVDPDKPLVHFFISDNVIEGEMVWGEGDRGAKNDEWRGIQLDGLGHEICYNRVRAFKDGIDTFPSKYCSAIDIHHNEVSECKDDGCEMDFSERNCRNFMNRYTNVFQGVSEQPIFGGPCYIFRNVLYNVDVEPFKLHHNGGPTGPIDWWPSGAILYHNTIVKHDEPDILYSPGPVWNIVSRNNLYIGGGKRAIHFDAPMNDCDYDYDGFGGGPWLIFMKWNKVFYKTIDEAHEKAPVQRHSVMVDAATVFANGLQRPDEVKKKYDAVDARLAAGSAAVDAGESLPGFNDGFAGKAPDLGACELGSELPHYGPRP